MSAGLDEALTALAWVTAAVLAAPLVLLVVVGLLAVLGALLLLLTVTVADACNVVARRWREWKLYRRQW